MADAGLQFRVKELIPDNEDRSKLFEALKRYQSNQDLHRLLVDLRKLLNEPSRLEIYDLMRPLISLKHQIDYSLRSPVVPGIKLRVVRLQKRTNESLGFSVKGGFEHGVGIFVNEVIPGSQADRQGLRVGDEIVRVNGFTISEAIHDDVLNLIRSRDDIILKVTYIGMVPVKEDPDAVVAWKYVDNNTIETDGEEQVPRPRDSQSEIKIFVDTSGHQSLGCTIQSDATIVPGIFVEKVRPGTLAEEVGLEPGDQLVEVNETSFKNLTHQAAVLALKSSRQLHMIVKKGVGLHYFRNLAAAVNQPTPPPVDNFPTPPPPPPKETTAPPPPPVEHHPPSPGLQGRSYDANAAMDQARMIDQHLDMKPPSWVQRHGPSGVSAINVSAEVHVNDYSRSRPAPMGGAAAMLEERRMHPNGTPVLLGPPDDFTWSEHVPASIYAKFNSDELDGRSLKLLSFPKSAELGIEVEGGLGSPLGGKIMVAMVFDGGVAKASEKMCVGDQLMLVNGKLFLDISVTDAEHILQDLSSPSSPETVELYYCESLLVNDEDNITYF